MASIIINGGVPASHSANARRSQRVYADVQVVNEGNADGFAELVLMGDLSGTSGVQRVNRGGGGALLKAYSNYISGGGPYNVTAIVFEVVNGQRKTFLARHDNFTANIVVPRFGGGGGYQSQENYDAEAAAAAAAAAARAEAEAAAEQLRKEQEAEWRRQQYEAMAEESEEPEPEPVVYEPDPVYEQFIEDDPYAPQWEPEPQPEPVTWEPVVVADPWQTEESDWVEPEFTWDPWMEEG